MLQLLKRTGIASVDPPFSVRWRLLPGYNRTTRYLRTSQNGASPKHFTENTLWGTRRTYTGFNGLHYPEKTKLYGSTVTAGAESHTDCALSKSNLGQATTSGVQADMWGIDGSQSLADAYKCQEPRIGADSRRLAVSSLTNCSALGSHWSVRASLIEISAIIPR